MMANEIQESMSSRRHGQKAHVNPEPEDPNSEERRPEDDPGETDEREEPSDETGIQRERKNDPRRNIDPEPTRRRVGVEAICPVAGMELAANDSPNRANT